MDGQRERENARARASERERQIDRERETRQRDLCREGGTFVNWIEAAASDRAASITAITCCISLICKTSQHVRNTSVCIFANISSATRRDISAQLLVHAATRLSPVRHALDIGESMCVCVCVCAGPSQAQHTSRHSLTLT
jgi:hypothetical protein